MRGQVNMVDEAKLCSPVCSTFEMLAVWHAVGCWSWITIGPILLPNASCGHCRCWWISLICWAYFSDVMVLPGFRNLEWIRLAADHKTVTMTIFGCKFGFGNYFRLSSWSNHWDGHCQLLYKIHFSSHITVQLINGLLLYRIREDDTSKWWFLKNFQSAHEAPTYQAFSSFQFASNAEWPRNGEGWILWQLLM